MNVNDLQLMAASIQASYLYSPDVEESNKYFPSTPKHIGSGDTTATFKR